MHLRQGGCPGAQPPSRQIAPTQASRTHYTGNSLASPAWVCRTDGLTSLPSPSSCKTLREQEIRSLKEMRSVTMRLSTPPAEPPPRRTWVQGGRRVLSGESWLWHWPGRRQSSWIRLRHSWWHVYLQSARGGRNEKVRHPRPTACREPREGTRLLPEGRPMLVGTGMVRTASQGHVPIGVHFCRWGEVPEYLVQRKNCSFALSPGKPVFLAAVLRHGRSCCLSSDLLAR